jgi:hypothetical protein
MLEVIKSTFDRDAILRTNDCLRYLFLGGLDTMAGLIGDELTSMTTSLADGVVARINDSIDSVKAHLKGTLGQMGREGVQDSPTGKSFANKKALLDKGGVQARWAADKMAAKRDDLELALAEMPLEMDSRFIEELKKLAKLAYDADNPEADSLAKIAIDLAGDLKKSCHKGGLSAFDLVEFLTYCQRMVAMGGKLIAATVRIVLGLVADALAALRKRLDTAIDIPGLKQLGTLILGRTPTLGDLVTFVPAVAITVFWKVCTFGRGDEVAGAGLEPFPKPIRDKLLQEGPFSSTEVAGGPSIPRFMIAYYRRTLVKAFGGKPSLDDAKIVDDFVSEKNRGAWRWLAPINNCLKLVATVLSATVGAVLDGVRDGMNIAQWGSGKVPGRVRTFFFTVPSIILSATGQLTEMVKNATIEMEPNSDDGKRWANERTVLLPWDGPSLSWVCTAIFSIVGFAMMNVADPANILLGALYALAVVGGSVVLFFTVYYTAALITFNSNGGKPINGWRIANEITTILGSGPALWGLLVPALALATRAGGPLMPLFAVLSAGLLLLNATLTVVAGVMAAGNIISDSTIKGWGFPKLEAAEACS